MNQLTLFKLESRYTEMRDAWLTYHRAHPEVWHEVVRIGRDLWMRGWRRYSIDAVIQVIRYQRDVKIGPGESFKINDHHRAFYARMFALVFPHMPLFSFREQRSQHAPASGRDDRPALPVPVDLATRDLEQFVSEFHTPRVWGFDQDF